MIRVGTLWLLLASPAWAEVCDKIRPGWDGAPATMWSEAVTLFLSPLGVLLLVLSLLALRVRHQWVGMGAILGWTGYVTFVTMGDPARRDAIAEGCVGPPTLFIAAAAAICVAIVLYTRPRDSGD